MSNLPYLQVCLGYFNNVGSAWRLSGLGEIADNRFSLIRINNSVSIHAVLRFSGGTAYTLPLSVGSGASSGLLICAILQVFSATDYRLYANGVQANGSTSLGSFSGFSKVDRMCGYLQGGVYLTGFGFGRALTDAQALQISRNPRMLWNAFAIPTRAIFLPSVGSGVADPRYLANGQARAYASYGSARSYATEAA